MADPISIVGRRSDDRAQADAKLCLEEWLARVESGEITSVAVVGTGPGRVEFGHSAFIDANIVGATAILQQRMVSLLTEDD